MTPSKAAEVIGCTPRHVRALIQRGKLAAKKVHSDSAPYFRYEITAAEARRYAREPQTRGFPRGGKRIGPRGKEM